MTDNTRIYTVEEKGSDTIRLIQAATPAQAVRFASRGRFVAKVASQAALVELVGSGVKVEQAGD